MQEVILKKLSSMREDDFTKDIIIPLLYKLGHEKVIYNGGVNENGKDIICWTTDEIGDKEVSVAQVKMKKLSTSSSSNNSFSTVISQLQQASEERIKNEDGKEYLPSTVYYISPIIIQTRELQTRFRPVSTNVRLKMIGGDKLYKLLTVHLPEVINDLTDNVNNIQETLMSEVVNEELFSALNIFDKKDIVDYYSNLDIDYYSKIVQITSNNVKENKLICTLDSKEWIKFKNIINDIEKENKVVNKLIDIKNIELLYKKSNSSKNNSKIKKLQEHYKNIKEFEINLNKLLDSFMYHLDNERDIKIVVDKVSETENKSYKFLHRDFIKLKSECEIFINYFKNINVVNLLLNNLKLENLTIKNHIKNIESKCDLLMKNSILMESQLKPILNQIIKINSNIDIELTRILELKQNTLENKEHFLLLDLKLITKYINYILLYEIKNINDNDKFINTIMKLNETIHYIIQLSNIFHYIKVDYIAIEHLCIEKDNLVKEERHVDDLLNNNISVFIEGNAGAGKTTTLQHYAYINKTKNCLYIPLSKLSRYITKDEIKNNFINELMSSLIIYMNNKNIKITEEQFIEILINENTVLLFDGLDEILSKHPWIYEAIQSIISKYNTLTCVTSRPGYVNNYENLLFIKLMEFNENQQNKFIYGWFKCDKKKADKLINHINNNNIKDLIKNPLVATIFCSLVEQNIPLPLTETSLYEERYRLLFGDYDINKQISRNKNHRRDLEYIAIKIAFIFHKNKTRTMEKYSIITNLIDILENKYEEEKIENIVNELIVPCNILFQESDDKRFTFGHLRYQEYLVAKEFQNNRGLEIKHYMSDNWWKGSLVLFSQLTDDIKFILDDIILNYFQIKDYEDILNAMITIRPIREQDDLFKLIKDYHKLDAENDIFLDYD